jgi:hypothetical protein
MPLSWQSPLALPDIAVIVDASFASSDDDSSLAEPQSLPAGRTTSMYELVQQTLLMTRFLIFCNFQKHLFTAVETYEAGFDKYCSLDRIHASRAEVFVYITEYELFSSSSFLVSFAARGLSARGLSSQAILESEYANSGFNQNFTVLV